MESESEGANVSTLIPVVDPEGLLEYSVVFNDRALNHMSLLFQGVMRDISATLKRVYGAEAAVVVPGGGSYGMEAVARQFATDAHCLVLRNGWFSYRWTQIFEAGRIAARETVLKARPLAEGPRAAYAPAPIEEVEACIRAERPDLVFAAHVETASGIILPDDYLRRVAAAVHEVGGMFVLDCVASGAIWVNMREVGADVLISAPQKGWSAPSSSALVMLSERALARIEITRSSSFACDLGRWLQIMRAYESGSHAYHATLPTDALARLRDAMRETEAEGFEALRERQWQLGGQVRALLAEHGFPSVAASGFEAPGVVVCYTDDDAIHSGRAFIEQGVQSAAGVPLACDEPPGFKTFRLGLFGLDKLRNVERTVAKLEQALAGMGR